MAWDGKKFKQHQDKSHKEKRESQERSRVNVEARRNPKRGEQTGKK